MKNLKIINLTLAFLWIYQGLVPKVLFINPDEILIWEWIGLSHEYAELAGQASGVGGNHIWFTISAQLKQIRSLP